MSMPNISLRDYICWRGQPPSEPTSTLVLTSKENYYVDLRICKPLTPAEPPLPNTGGPSRRLEWGFAGLSESWPVPVATPSLASSAPTSPETTAIAADDHDDDDTTKPKNARWWHWVDSRAPLSPAAFCSGLAPQSCFGHPPATSNLAHSAPDDDPFIEPPRAASPTFSSASTLGSGTSAVATPLLNFLPVTDAGVLHPVPGDAARTLETGAMVNPATGALTAYEEMWRDVRIASVAAEAKVAGGAVGEEGVKYSVVLTLEMPAICARGMVVRVGQWCQGIVMIGAGVTVERWKYVGGEGKAGSGDWTRRVRLGDGFLPVAVAFRAAGVKVGDVCRHGDMAWTVREKFEWRE